MKQYFELEPKERKQEKYLSTAAIASFIITAIGIFTQFRHININNILVPAFLFSCISYLIIYAVNGFENGNLIRKWTPSYIYVVVSFLTTKLLYKDDVRNSLFVRKFFSIAAILISITLFLLAIIYLAKGKFYIIHGLESQS